MTPDPKVSDERLRELILIYEDMRGVDNEGLSKTGYERLACLHELLSLRTAASADAVDAQDLRRYRWLREGDYSWNCEKKLRDGHGWLLTDDDLDTAIDAAMEAPHDHT